MADGAPPPGGGTLSRKLAEKLVAEAAAARISRRLVELATDLDLGLNLQQLRLRG